MPNLLRRRYTRAFFVLLAAVLVAGCRQGSHYNPNVKIIDLPNSSPVSENFAFDGSSEYGLVVSGMHTADGTPGTDSWASMIPLFEMEWQRLDPETGELVFERRHGRNMAAFTSSRHTCYGKPACYHDDYTRLQFNMNPVIPGTYVLARLHVWENPHKIVYFTPQERSLVYETKPAALYEKKLLPGFEIEAGEIVYIGNYVFNAMGEFPELLRIENTPDEARNVLALYSKLSGEMVDRVPELMQ